MQVNGLKVTAAAWGRGGFLMQHFSLPNILLLCVYCASVTPICAVSEHFLYSLPPLEEGQGY